MIIGISVGGFIVFVVTAIALLAILSRKFMRRVEPTGDDPFSGRKKPERFNGSTDNPVLVTDSEGELGGIVSRGIKTTETFEMKNMPGVD